MAKILSNSGITTNDTIRAGHVTQSIDALTGTDAYDITISGSLTSTGNLINTGGYALFVRSSSIPNSVLNVRQEGSGSIAEFGGIEIADQEQIIFNLGGHITASGNVSSSAVSTASFGTYLGDGSQLTGITGGGSGIFTPTGSFYATTNDLQITGSLTVSGSFLKSNTIESLNGSSILDLDALDVATTGFGAIYLDTNGGDLGDRNGGFLYMTSGSGIGFCGIGYKDPTTEGSIVIAGDDNEIRIATTGELQISASVIRPSGGVTMDIGTQSQPFDTLYANTGSFLSDVSSSATSTASFGTYLGDGSQLTNLQRPISNSVSTNVTASNLNSGYYFRTGGNITCSIQSNAIVSCDVGSEFEFFQTSSAGNLLFHTGSGVTLNSKNGSTKLSNQFSAATLKKIDTNEWDLIGDLS